MVQNMPNQSYKVSYIYLILKLVSIKLFLQVVRSVMYCRKTQQDISGSQVNNLTGSYDYHSTRQLFISLPSTTIGIIYKHLITLQFPIYYFLFTSTVQAVKMNIALVHPEISPISPNLLQQAILQNFQSQLEIDFQQFIVVDFTESPEITTGIDVIINLTDNIQFEIQLERFAREREIPYFSPKLYFNTPYTFQLDLDYQAYLNSMKAFLKVQGWDDFAFFTSIELDNIRIDENIQEEFGIFAYQITNGIEYDTLLTLVGKMVRAKGIKIYVIKAQEQVSQQIKAAIIDTQIFTENSAMLSISTNLPKTVYNGEIFIIPVYSSLKTTYEESLAESFKKFFKENSNQDFPENEMRLRLLQSYTKDNKPKLDFNIINIQQGQPKIVGTISQNLEIKIEGEILYPGNTKNKPDKTKTKLNFSSAIRDTLPPPGTNNIFYFSLAQLLMLDYLKTNKTILQNFELQLTELNCGTNTQSVPYIEACIDENKDKFGLYFSPSVNVNAFYEQIRVLKKFEIDVPIINTSLYFADLADKEQHPLMVVVPSVQTHFWLAMSRFMRKLKIRQACYIADSIYGFNYQQEVTAYQQSGLKILNEAGKYMFNAASKLELQSLVQYILDLPCRYTIFQVSVPFQVPVLNEILQYGVKAVDIIFAAQSAPWGYIFYTEDQYTEQRIKLIQGSFKIETEILIGEVGDYLKDHAHEYGIPAETVSCHVSDGVLVIAESLNHVILKGDNYFDPYIVNRASRQVIFTGCTGLFKIGEGVNNRFFNRYQIEVVQGDAFEIWYYYTPYSVELWHEKLKSIEYGDGSFELPSESRIVEYKCVANEKEFSIQSSSIWLQIGIQGLIITLSVILGGWILKMCANWLYFKAQLLTNMQQFGFSEIALFSSMMLESFQFIGIAPRRGLSREENRNLNFVLLDFLNEYDLSYGLWKKVYNTLIAFTLVLITTLTSLIFRVHQKDNKFNAFNRLIELASRSLPYFIHLATLPIALNLNSIFSCYEAEEDNLQDTVFDIDCQEYCWKGVHLIYVIIISLLLFAYQLALILSSSYMQSLIEPCNVQSNTHFLISKTGFKFLLAALARPVQKVSHNLFSGVYLSMFIGYACSFYKFRPFNYDRTNLWQFILFSEIALIELIRVLAYNYYPNILLPAIFMCTLVLGIIGILVQNMKIPSKLYRIKGIRIEQLFKFQLGFRTAEELGLSMEYLHRKRWFNDPEVGAEYRVDVQMEDSQIKSSVGVDVVSSNVITSS